LFAEPIWASGHHAASQAGHMTAIAPLVRSCSRPLAPKGPSTHAPRWRGRLCKQVATSLALAEPNEGR